MSFVDPEGFFFATKPARFPSGALSAQRFGRRKV